VNSDTTIVERVDEADARLEVLYERREREIVGFTGTGRPREYQLRLRIRVRVTDAKGLEWMPATELVLRREITSSDIEVVNRAQEEELLFREMESDFVQQLLRRLSALKPRG
jgi:LPS-assembly lipoprotein